MVARESAEERETAMAQLRDLWCAMGALPSVAAEERNPSTDAAVYKTQLEQLVRRVRMNPRWTDGILMEICC
jgi:hypothetical protein